MPCLFEKLLFRILQLHYQFNPNAAEIPRAILGSKKKVVVSTPSTSSIVVQISAFLFEELDIDAGTEIQQWPKFPKAKPFMLEVACSQEV